MEQPAEDAAMDRDKQKKVSPAYALAAAAIWALVLYSLSSQHRPEPARVALRALQVCDSTR
jgi:hypothetical protein